MNPKAERKSARVLARLAIASFIVSAGVLSMAYAVPNSFAESAGVARLLFALAFFVRTFELHLALATLAPLALLLVLRRWWIAAVTATLPVWALAPIAFSYVSPAPLPVDRPLRVMTGNLLVGHAQVDPLLEQISRFAPDVIFFQEYTPAKAERLVHALAGQYPHRVEAIRDHAFGQAIYSKIPFESEPELYPHARIREQGALKGRAGTEVGIWDAQIRAVIRLDGAEIVLQNVHYAPPIRSSYLKEQRVMTKWLCEWLANETRPVIIAGDFNCTPASANLSDLHRAGLTNSRRVARGWAGTWPASGLPSIAPVTIDHVLIRGLRCEFSSPGTNIASDHLPVLAIVGRE